MCNTSSIDKVVFD